MTMVKVYPVSGRQVRHPETKAPIPAGGVMVVWGSFWQRRLADGDIEVGQKKKAPQKSEGAEK